MEQQEGPTRMRASFGELSSTVPGEFRLMHNNWGKFFGQNILILVIILVVKKSSLMIVSLPGGKHDMFLFILILVANDIAFLFFKYFKGFMKVAWEPNTFYRGALAMQERFSGQ